MLGLTGLLARLRLPATALVFIQIECLVLQIALFADDISKLFKRLGNRFGDRVRLALTTAALGQLHLHIAQHFTQSGERCTRFCRITQLGSFA